jgi:uncharacterized membrane protein YfcA
VDNINTDMLIFLMVSGFAAAFVDSVVGGGGLISLPAFLLTGLPPAVALGTNKMASVMSTLTSTLSFFRSGKIDVGLVRCLFPLSLIGSVLGVYVVQLIPPHFLKPLLVVLLFVVGVYSLCKKDFGEVSTYRGLSRKKGILSGLLVFLLGFYDGFFGPGAGTFFLFGFLLMGFDFVVAAGNSRALNFASNLAAVVAFAVRGLVNYYYSIPVGVAMVAGAWVGSRLAITQGVTYVRPLFIAVTCLLIGKQVWDLFF